MLTPEVIKQAKCPTDKKHRKLFDAHGLYILIVQKTGEKLWRHKYYFEGRERLLSYGSFPSVTLKRAREKRDEARALLADGIDPSAKRKAEKQARGNTFEIVAREFLARQSKTLKPGTVAQDEERLTRLIFPKIGNRPIGSIAAPDLLTVLRAIDACGHHELARRMRSLCGRIFQYGIATGRAQRDISADLKGALTPVKVTGFAAITEPRRIGELLRAIDGYQGQPATMYALRLAPLVFVRPGELRGAQWAEFDLSAAEWRIPGERMKEGHEHVVPLSTQALRLLAELQVHTGGGKFLFPSLRSNSRPMSNNTVNAALRRLGFTSDEMTGHGFRKTASTLLNEKGFNPDAIERQLAHVDKDKVRATYNRSQRMQERKELMQAWADYLDQLRAGAQVVPIRSVA